MTTVKYEASGRWCLMEVKGHAGYATLGGPDIVCAAVSMLACTLLSCVAREYREGRVARLEHRRKSGDVTVHALAAQGEEERLRLIFETIFTGYRMLEEKYPQNVKVF